MIERRNAELKTLSKLIFVLLLLQCISQLAFAFTDEPPVAQLSKSTYTANEGTRIVFDASSSYDPDGSSLHYRWDFENDGMWTGWAVNPKQSWTWYDDFTGIIKLKVSDGLLTNETTADVIINNVPPSVDAGSDMTKCLASTFQFRGSFSDPGGEDSFTMLWDFGDGENASGLLHPTHVYSAAGIYIVSLNVTDDDGGVGFDSITVTVLDCPVSPATIESCDPYGNPKNEFSCVQPPPKGDIHVIGNGFPSNIEVPVYVVKDVSDWFDGISISSLKWASGALVQTNSDGDILVTNVWESAVATGYFDIVADVNSNGIYDAGVDAIDNDDIHVTAGFFVIPEVPVGPLFVFIACILAFYAYRIKR